VDYFSSLFTNFGKNHVGSQMKVIKNYPRFFYEEDSGTIFVLISMKEIEMTLKSFAQSKSPRPDDWSVEFFLHFFDIFGLVLVEMVEESRLSGEICGA